MRNQRVTCVLTTNASAISVITTGGVVPIDNICNKKKKLLPKNTGKIILPPIYGDIN